MISVPQLLFFVLPIAKPRMPFALTVFVSRALPAQISTASKSCNPKPENGVTLVAALLIAVPLENQQEPVALDLHWNPS